MLKNRFLKNKLWRTFLVSAAAGCVYKLISLIIYNIARNYFVPDHPGNNYDLEPSDLFNHEPFLKEYDLYLEALDIFYDRAAIILGIISLSLFILLCFFAFRDMTRNEIFKSSMVLVFYSYALYIISDFYWSIKFSGRSFFPSYTVFDNPRRGIFILPLHIFGEAALFLGRYENSVWIIESYLSYYDLFEFIAMILPLSFVAFAKHRKTHSLSYYVRQILKRKL